MKLVIPIVLFALVGCGIQEDENHTVSCSNGYVKIDPMWPYTVRAFCAAPYEMRDGGGGAPVSVSKGDPWNLPRDSAETACRSIYARLPTNAEWQTIARQAETMAANWSGGSVGVGTLSGDTTYLPGGTLHNLGNGVWEHVSGDIVGDPGYVEFIYRITDDTHPSRVFVSGVEGSAKYHFGSTNDYQHDPGLGLMNRRFSHSIMRGGDNVEPGIFGAALNHGPTDESSDVGFRCVY